MKVLDIGPSTVPFLAKTIECSLEEIVLEMEKLMRDEVSDEKQSLYQNIHRPKDEQKWAQLLNYAKELMLKFKEQSNPSEAIINFMNQSNQEQINFEELIIRVKQMNNLISELEDKNVVLYLTQNIIDNQKYIEEEKQQAPFAPYSKVIKINEDEIYNIVFAQLPLKSESPTQQVANKINFQKFIQSSRKVYPIMIIEASEDFNQTWEKIQSNAESYSNYFYKMSGVLPAFNFILKIKDQNKLKSFLDYLKEQQTMTSPQDDPQYIIHDLLKIINERFDKNMIQILEQQDELVLNDQEFVSKILKEQRTAILNPKNQFVLNLDDNIREKINSSIKIHLNNCINLLNSSSDQWQEVSYLLGTLNFVIKEIFTKKNEYIQNYFETFFHKIIQNFSFKSQQLIKEQIEMNNFEEQIILLALKLAFQIDELLNLIFSPNIRDKFVISLTKTQKILKDYHELKTNQKNVHFSEQEFLLPQSFKLPYSLEESKIETILKTQLDEQSFLKKCLISFNLQCVQQHPQTLTRLKLNLEPYSFDGSFPSFKTISFEQSKLFLDHDYEDLNSSIKICKEQNYEDILSNLPQLTYKEQFCKFQKELLKTTSSLKGCLVLRHKFCKSLKHRGLHFRSKLEFKLFKCYIIAEEERKNKVFVEQSSLNLLKFKQQDDQPSLKQTRNDCNFNQKNNQKANNSMGLHAYCRTNDDHLDLKDNLYDSCKLSDDQSLIHQNSYRRYKQATIHSEQQFQIQRIIDILGINKKLWGQKLTRLSMMIDDQRILSSEHLKSYMRQFKKFAEDVLFQGQKGKHLHHIEVEWCPYSNELITSLVLAMVDRQPDQIYGNQVYDEIKRLELLGESLTEYLFMITTITSQSNWNLLPNDIENLRIQNMKYSHLNEVAFNFQLQNKTLCNEVCIGGTKRELYQIVHSLVGALAIWSGVEHAFNLLFILKVIQPQPQQIQKPTSKEETKDIQIDEEINLNKIGNEEQASQNEKKNWPNLPSDDYLCSLSKQYSENISLSRNFLEKHFKFTDEKIEQSIEKLIKPAISDQLSKEEKDLLMLSFVDQSFNDSLGILPAEMSSQQEFLASNFHNIKLKAIGSAFINLMFQTKFYYKTIELRNHKTKENSVSLIEEAMINVTSAPWQSFCLIAKFINNDEKFENLVPLIHSDKKAPLLRASIMEYERAFAPIYRKFFTKVSSSEISEALTNYSSDMSLQSYTFGSSIGTVQSSFSEENKERNLISDFFTYQQPNTQMEEIAEKFVPEFATTLNAIVGATMVGSGFFNFKRGSQVARYLLSQNTELKFPRVKEMESLQELWNSKNYSRVLRMGYIVDLSKCSEQIYYKCFVQSLEIRRVKFKPTHNRRMIKYCKDVYDYLKLCNEIFEFNQTIANKLLLPYEYILHHQQFRKYFKVGMTLDDAKKVMSAQKSDQIRIEPVIDQQNKVTQIIMKQNQRVFDIVSKIIKDQKTLKRQQNNQIKEIIQIFADQIDTDSKSNQLKLIEKQKTNGIMQIDIKFYIQRALNIFALLKQNIRMNQRSTNETANQTLFEDFDDKFSQLVAQNQNLFNDEIDLSEGASNIFNEDATFEQLINFIEQTAILYEPHQMN